MGEMCKIQKLEGIFFEKLASHMFRVSCLLIYTPRFYKLFYQIKDQQIHEPP